MEGTYPQSSSKLNMDNAKTFLIFGLVFVGVISLIFLLACLKEQFCHKPQAQNQGPRTRRSRREEREKELLERLKIVEDKTDEEKDKDEDKLSEVKTEEPPKFKSGEGDHNPSNMEYKDNKVNSNSPKTPTSRPKKHQDGMNEMYDGWERQKQRSEAQVHGARKQSKGRDEDLDSLDEFFDTHSSPEDSSLETDNINQKSSVRSPYSINGSLIKKEDTNPESEANQELVEEQENVFEKWRKIAGETPKRTPSRGNHSGSGDTGNHQPPSRPGTSN